MYRRTCIILPSATRARSSALPRSAHGRPMPTCRRTFIPQDEDVIVQPHPLSVAPLGQLLLQDASAENLRDSLGLLSSLPDEAIVMITDCCSAVTLARCSMVSRGLRIFCSSDELWRTRVIEELPEGVPLRYSGTWLQTYLQQTTSRPCDGARAPMGGRLFSDALFTSWFCGTASIPRRWTQYENIERVSASALSVAEFASRFEEPGVPVITVGVKEFMCIGALPPFDHPHVFLDMGADSEIICQYCSTLYRYRAGLKADEAEPQACVWRDDAKVAAE